MATDELKIYKNTAQDLSLGKLFASSPHLIFGVDDKNYCIFINETAAKASGTQAEAVLHKPISKIGIFGGFLLPIFEKILKGDPFEAQEFEMILDNQKRCLEVHANRISNEDNEIIGAIAILQDLTDRKQKELELNEVRSKLEAQMKALDVFDIVAETDRRGRITYVNDQFVAISKYSREELLGQDHRIINSGFHPKSFFREMWAKISHGQIWSGEVRNRAKDGTIYWVSTVITPILDSSGKIKSFLAVRRDITKQKETEEAVKESEARFRELLDNVNLLAVGLSVRGKIVFANSALLRFVGKSKEEIFDLDWFTDFIPERDRDQIFEIFSKTLIEDNPPSEYEGELLSSTGEKRTILWKNTLFRDQKGEVIGITALGEDVTERKLAEKRISELRKKHEEQREQILAFVSHELRSPVNSIVVNLDMLRNYHKGEGYGSAFPPEKMMQQISQQIERILRVSKDFMECSVHRAGGFQFEFKPTHLNRLLKEICHTFSEKLALKPNLSLKYNPSEVEIIGYWDAGRLDQVFTNLISNAIKYTRPDSRSVEVKSSIENNAALITISDDGMGIPEESLEHLFQLFSRADNAKNSSATGFGLGLKISKDIVEKHGGKIWVESTLNVGSHFHVLLPLQPLSKI